MVLIELIQQAAEGAYRDGNDDAQQASFFGFMGIAAALVFASK